MGVHIFISLDAHVLQVYKLIDDNVLLTWILWMFMFYLDAYVFGNIVQSINIHILQVPV